MSRGSFALSRGLRAVGVVAFCLVTSVGRQFGNATAYQDIEGLRIWVSPGWGGAQVRIQNVSSEAALFRDRPPEFRLQVPDEGGHWVSASDDGRRADYGLPIFQRLVRLEPGESKTWEVPYDFDMEVGFLGRVRLLIVGVSPDSYGREVGDEQYLKGARFFDETIKTRPFIMAR